jgi:hypothetical protein
MRTLLLASLAVAATLATQPVLAGPQVVAGGYVTTGNFYGGARWGGGGYRPVYGPGYGYGGWRYGYPGYGYGYGYGYGLGLGYGVGWALGATSPWYWGAPAISYAAPTFYPYSVVAPVYPGIVVSEQLTYIQQPQIESTAPAPARRADGLYYYCTEPAGYHPYVAQCSRPWIAVQPQSASPADASR